MNRRFFIGPMSKNVVDSILEFTQETHNQIGLIPSRRQVEYNGGYVNNWTTKEFKEYSKFLIIERDHSGPDQGYLMDDGYESLREDCKYFDMIHIDPWKKYPDFQDGLNETIKMIKFCHSINSNIEFEVGTEEAIRHFDVSELNDLMIGLKNTLSDSEFKKIKYLVIQSGTSLSGNINTGTYDKERLLSMVNICKKYNVLSKEHNGDYMPVSLIHEKFDLGLDSINIAPEFGLIETQTYLDRIENQNLIDIFFRICYESKRWVKWVNEDFDPLTNKIELIRICGHYVLSSEKFITEIKSKYENIDDGIKKNIKNKLYELCRYETKNNNL